MQSYAALGLRFAGPPGVPEETLLQQAWSYLSDVPDVGTAVFALVRAIHLLESPGPNYDISHSDPDLPCSIFLSLPVGEPHAALRAAESILHEAMHLQLTLLEAEVPVVQLSSSTLYSPWQRRQRPISGVVHGLYVFVAIEVYLSELLLQGDLPRDSASFALKRCREIAEEIEQAAVVAAHEDLTLFGRRFTEGLIAGRQRRGWGGGRSLGR
ncbi:MAG: HEXXH motif-containing putative peptide modification protein [Methylocystis sp.]|uniref:aKG-HExxH-type peptide beta-hydroxylase n=1 Tax=Methylocystis sp. TaxID=1911079 RepID=UPI003D09D04C